MEIEKAKFEDTLEISELAQVLFRFHSDLDSYYAHNDKSLDVTVKTYGGWIRSNKFRFYVAKEKGSIVGFIIGKIEKDEPIYLRAEKGIVIALFVKDTYRERGLARELFTYLSAWFKTKGISDVELYVHANNVAAMGAWTKLGFIIDSHRMRRAI